MDAVIIWLTSTTGTIVAAALIGLSVCCYLLTPLRKAINKTLCIGWAHLSVDIGFRGLVRMLIYAASTGGIAGLMKGFGSGGVDMSLFWPVCGAVMSINLFMTALDESMGIKRVLEPGAGRHFSTERKNLTSGLLRRINSNLKSVHRNPDEAKQILTDLLDTIVLHVRDYRGCVRDDRPVVFANVLVVEGDSMVVIARDAVSHSPEYRRDIPQSYPKASLLCGRAVESGRVISTGDLLSEYPETNANKQYKSILAIPLFPEDGKPYGALSIDSTRSYFFEGLNAGKLESDLENTLQPYIQMITLVMEQMVSPDTSKLGKLLSEGGGP